MQKEESHVVFFSTSHTSSACARAACHGQHWDGNTDEATTQRMSVIFKEAAHAHIDVQDKTSDEGETAGIDALDEVESGSFVVSLELTVPELVLLAEEDLLLTVELLVHGEPVLLPPKRSLPEYLDFPCRRKERGLQARGMSGGREQRWHTKPAPLPQGTIVSEALSCLKTSACIATSCEVALSCLRFGASVCVAISRSIGGILEKVLRTSVSVVALSEV